MQSILVHSPRLPRPADLLQTFINDTGEVNALSLLRQTLERSTGAQQKLQEGLSRCQEENERKDEIIESQKKLIQRAALTHCELIVTYNVLTGAYHWSKQAPDISTPLMQHLRARGKKHSDKASVSLDHEETTETTGSKQCQGNERMTKLMEVPKEKSERKVSFDAFVNECDVATAQDTLAEWLAEQLKESGLPRERRGM